MATIKEDDNGYIFWCPGCEQLHAYPKNRGWNFNGDFEKPSFTPSLLIRHWNSETRTMDGTDCHLYVTNGEIHYCDDCPHPLSSKVVPMVDLENIP